MTPRSVWNPDIEDPYNHRSHWLDVPDNGTFDNAFRAQWEQFLRHVVDEEAFPWDFVAGARGVQLAELGLLSARQGRRFEVPVLSL